MISSCLQEFNKTIPEYQPVLNKIENKQINSTQPQKTDQETKQDYLVQPPFNEEVNTNIVKEFFTLLNFQSSNKYHKIVKNNIKLSYKCLANMKSIINKQNTSCLNNPDNKVDTKQCNCRSAINCLLNRKCCRNAIVYKGSLKTGQMDKLYYCSCET